VGSWSTGWAGLDGLLQQCPCGVGVSHRGLLVEAEHLSEVKRVGPLDHGFFKLPVNAKSLQNRVLAAQGRAADGAAGHMSARHNCGTSWRYQFCPASEARPQAGHQRPAAHMPGGAFSESASVSVILHGGETLKTQTALTCTASARRRTRKPKAGLRGRNSTELDRLILAGRAWFCSG
jgi:hypothetical protein